MLLWVCVLWVFGSALVALLPMRTQYVPGVALLLAAPMLIMWIGMDVAWWAALLAALAFMSMYRNPLRYFWARLTGQRPELPK